jgi:hypothetical protein
MSIIADTMTDKRNAEDRGWFFNIQVTPDEVSGHAETDYGTIKNLDKDGADGVDALQVSTSRFTKSRAEGTRHMPAHISVINAILCEIDFWEADHP